ncbi:hypothetical protein [uncultured Massilia sp.]|uniref:hypothetical protein n=1 Tax=uncultured Massilia sp. TaxID=169973 RepID=UPI0025DF1BB3|nr:hypothetical protein [uncultured Massilia sp.]
MKRTILATVLVLGQAMPLQAAWADAGYLRSRTVQRDGRGNTSRDVALDAAGPRGTVAAQRSYRHAGDGAASATRTLRVTDAATGNSFQRNASYEKGQGITRSAGCTDAAGAPIACRGH